MEDGKYEVGDKVKTSEIDVDITVGKAYAVTRSGPFGFSFDDDEGDERYREHDDDEWSLFSSISPGDTVRLTSGLPFTDGNYTATVDNVTAGGVVLLTTGGWLAGDLVEKVEALTVEAGKSYVAANGSVHGPMLKFNYGTGFVRALGDGHIWNADGTNQNANRYPDAGLNFVKEAVAEPTTIAPTPAAAPAVAEWVPKVGDRVQAVEDFGEGRPKGSKGTVYNANNDGHSFDVQFDQPFDGWGTGESCWFVMLDEIGPVAESAPATVTTTNDNSLTITIDATCDFNALAEQFQRVADAIRAAA